MNTQRRKPAAKRANTRVKTPKWFIEMSLLQQKRYLAAHPNSKLHGNGAAKKAMRDASANGKNRLPNKSKTVKSVKKKKPKILTASQIRVRLAISTL
jgi:hypothetical protein